MDIAKARDFIGENHRGVLTTYRQDGSLQMSPISVGIDPDGLAIISSRETAYKVKNLRRDPRTSVCVFVDDFFGRWLQIDGTAEILSLPAALEPLVDYYRTNYGEHPNWDEYRAAMVKEQRLLIRIDIERAGPDRHG